MPLWLTTPMTRPESFSSSCTGRPSGRLPDASTRSTTRSTAGTSLERAWEEVRRNRGAPGVDGVTIAQVERQGVEGFLDELAVQLQDGTYRPLPVRRVTIPKPQGGERNLGVPAVRDRVVQAAAKAVLEPIFEADFLDCSFGFRPGRSAHQALEAIRVEVNRGRCWVVDADIASFFDSIRPEVLGAALAERVSDRRMRKLIMGWLKAGVLAGETLLHPRAGKPPARQRGAAPPGPGVAGPASAAGGAGALLRRPGHLVSDQGAGRGGACGADRAAGRPRPCAVGVQDQSGGPARGWRRF